MIKVYVTKSTLPDINDYIEEINDIWKSCWLTNMGTKHNILKKELIKYLDVPKVELFTNGHMALELSIQALNLHGEIITSPFTFASTTHAIVRNGCTPVFCDINKDDFTIDVGKIEKLITKNTVAIMPIHVYGNICDVEAIDKIAKKYGLKVIYDAAHAFGESYKNISIGNFGDISCFSFHATKVFNTIEGGAASFEDKAIGKKLYQLKNFGIKNEEEVDGIGANAKMNEFCAAMGLCNIKNIENNIDKRKKIYEYYIELLHNIPGLRLNKLNLQTKYNYSYFPIVVDPEKYGNDRNFIYKCLKNNNIIARKYFYPITNEFSCYKGIINPGDTPIAKEISQKVLTLPLYPDLDIKIVEKICKIIEENGR